MDRERRRAFDARIGKRLRSARLAAGLSQEAAGDKLGVSFAQIQKFENGENGIKAVQLSMLAQSYNKPVDWFFGRELAATERDIVAEFFTVAHARELALSVLLLRDPGAMVAALNKVISAVAQQ